MERLYRGTKPPESDGEVVEIQERIVLLEVRRAKRGGRILSRRIVRFLTPEEEDDLLRRIAGRLRAEDV
ncbi:MAG: hypothetical protein QMC81_07030 [Thermoanaerobacterales bacterium]|nr:hypothetical protein [Bacillota bacterium]MDI6907219.1 hypothetical protein [Thermoanaerobacterales bacterium]